MSSIVWKKHYPETVYLGLENWYMNGCTYYGESLHMRTKSDAGGTAGVVLGSSREVAHSHQNLLATKKPYEKQNQIKMLSFFNKKVFMYDVTIFQRRLANTILKLFP